MAAKMDMYDRVWLDVKMGEADECWPWLLSSGGHGYGQLGWWEDGRSRMVLAHRIAWESANGRIPAGLTVDHMCRNRRCCNPSHMRLLTNAENARMNGRWFARKMRGAA